MRKPESWLRQIISLRLKHTRLCSAGEWVKAQTVREKIVRLWFGYHASMTAHELEAKTSPNDTFKFVVMETTGGNRVSQHRTIRGAMTSLTRRRNGPNSFGAKYEIQPAA